MMMADLYRAWAGDTERRAQTSPYTVRHNAACQARPSRVPSVFTSLFSSSFRNTLQDSGEGNAAKMLFPLITFHNSFKYFISPLYVR